ncbi:hypothetical protein KSP39_PZI004112 [Platanthera zijinensis]|uniref:Uncharacterized protein n=1 Tax=Platanthera zijinensis TaxID=2320716 RepID=A0AAP0BTR4_9ASPA
MASAEAGSAGCSEEEAEERGWWRGMMRMKRFSSTRRREYGDNLEPTSTSWVEPDSLDLMAAMFGQGLIGQGMPMKIALFATLATAGQNLAAFSINPLMLVVAVHRSCRSIEYWSLIYYGTHAVMAQQHNESPMFSRDYTTRNTTS